MRESCPKHVRQLIAQQAARMMADEGLADYAHAKRKAARQLGLPEDGCLPTNVEIDHAIREHMEIFHAATHEQHLDRLRQGAIHIMQQFARFDPHLAGAVLDGTAGRYATTEIHLVADSMKEVELFLLNRQIPYRMDERVYRAGQEKWQIPVFQLETDIGPVQLLVFDPQTIRAVPRRSRAGNSPERLPLSALTSLYARS